MHISLTPELESRIKAKLDAGGYDSANELIREALQFMEEHEDWVGEFRLAGLRQKLQAGIDQLENGEGIAISSKSALNCFFDDIKGKDAEDADSLPACTK